jgi:hypothetical protein
MSSLKQVEANRRNALKSTGPVTLEGKARSRFNALRHGLTAETVIAGLEDAEDYQAFEAAITADYEAETAVERELILRLASILWRLRRATGIETSLFEFAAGPTLEPRYSGPALVAGSEVSKDNHAKTVNPSATATGCEPSLDRTMNIVDAFMRLAALPTFPLDRLSRYEHLLWRQARQLLCTLELLRRRKRRPVHSRFPFSFRSDFVEKLK